MSTAQSSSDLSQQEKVNRMRQQAIEEYEEDNSTSASADGLTEEQEANALQQQIENSLSEGTVRLPVGDARVQFKTFNGDCSDCPDHPTGGKIEYGGDVSDMVALADERLNRMNADDFAEQYNDEVNWMCDVLEWSSKPDFADRVWWRKHFGIKRRREYLNLIQTERELSRDELKKLRRAGRA